MLFCSVGPICRPYLHSWSTIIILYNTFAVHNGIKYYRALGYIQTITI